MAEELYSKVPVKFYLDVEIIETKTSASPELYRRGFLVRKKAKQFIENKIKQERVER